MEACKGIVIEATKSSVQVIALQTQSAKEASDSSMARENNLSRQLAELQGRYDSMHKELCAEREKNGEQTVKLEQIKADAAKALLNRESQKEAITKTYAFGQEVLHNLAVKQLTASPANGASNGAATVTDRPSTEGLLDAMIADLSPDTLRILYGKVRPALLPLLADKPFLMSAYAAIVPMPPELIQRLYDDLGPTFSERIGALARSAGYEQ